MIDRPQANYDIPPSRRLERYEKEFAELRERISRLEAWMKEILGLDLASESVAVQEERW